MSERQAKARRSRETWTDIELRLLDDVIQRDEVLKRLVRAYRAEDQVEMLKAIDAAIEILGLE